MTVAKTRSVAFTLAMALVVLAAGPAAGQNAPRTPWGAPDLQGIWDFRTATPLERPEDRKDQAFLTAEEAASIERERVDRNTRLWEAAPRLTEAGSNVGGYNNFWLDFGTNVVEDRRTSLIVDPPDGRVPAVSEEGQRRVDERRANRETHPADSYLDRNAFDRCILGFNTGPPMTPGFYNQNMQLFQTPDHVVVLNEMVHDARIIPLDGRPRPAIESWTGESRGHWEGDTLVVETTHFSDKHGYRGSTTDRHLVERFTRLDRDTLLYEFTITDPATWTLPWTAQIPMQWNELPLFEYACHEGNYAMPNILAGERLEERKQESGQE